MTTDSKAVQGDWAEQIARAAMGRHAVDVVALDEVASQLRAAEHRGYTMGHKAGDDFRSAALASTAGAGEGDLPTDLQEAIQRLDAIREEEHRSLKDGGGIRLYRIAPAQSRAGELSLEYVRSLLSAVPASPRSGAGEGEGTKIDGKLYANVSTQPFQCPHCDCRSYARVGERKGDGDYRPGLLIRCVECKAVYRDANAVEFPTPDPVEHGVEIIKRLRAIAARGLDLDCQDFRTEDGEWIAASLWIDKAIAALSQGGGAGRSEKGEGEEEGRGPGLVEAAEKLAFYVDGIGGAATPTGEVLRKLADDLTGKKTLENREGWARGLYSRADLLEEAAAEIRKLIPPAHAQSPST